MTKSGVEADLKKSPYIYHGNYPQKIALFYFSTQNNLDRFEREKDVFLLDTVTSLSNRFRISFHLPQIFTDIVLYSRIEKRGFYVKMEGHDIKCVRDLRLTGAQLESMN